MPEQKPTQPMSSEAQPAASIEERIKVAGPIEVEGAFQSFFDLVDQHSSSLETAGKMGTLTTEQINAKNQELHADMDAFRVAYGMFEEWSTAPEESRGAFPSFIKDKVMHARATGDKDATKGADWGSKYYNNSLKSYFESQDASASQAEQEQPAPEHQVFREPTQAERQAQAVSNEEARQQLEGQQKTHVK